MRTPKLLCGALLAVVIVFGLPFVAHAANFVVSNTNDSGSGSLRQAIMRANNNTGADAIFFVSGVSGEITLTSGQLLITDDLTINGPDASVLAVSGNNSSRVFEVSSGATVMMSGMTVKEGVVPCGVDGGGIVNSGELVLTDSVIRDNGGSCGALGGGIANAGSMTVSNSVITENGGSVFGGGIYNGGSLTLTSTRVTRNSSPSESAGSGGGILNQGSLTVTKSVIRENDAIWGGGGIVNGGQLTVVASVISENSTDHEGGGIFNSQVSAVATIRNSRISGNIASFGGGISNSGGSVRFINTTIAGNNWGGIHNNFGGVIEVLSNSKVVNNSGRGIFNDAFPGSQFDNSTLIVRSSTVSGNDNGGIFNASLGTDRGTTNLISSTVSNNTAVTGGGVYNQGELTLVSSAITFNTATGGPGSGGGVFNDGGTVSLDANSTISNNIPDDCVGC